MTVMQQFDEEGIDARRFEYEDETVLAADFGSVRDETVDIVGGTVIVVANGEQYEFDVGQYEFDEAPRAFMNNGVLTIEVNA